MAGRRRRSRKKGRCKGREMKKEREQTFFFEIHFRIECFSQKRVDIALMPLSNSIREKRNRHALMASLHFFGKRRVLETLYKSSKCASFSKASTQQSDAKLGCKIPLVDVVESWRDHKLFSLARPPIFASRSAFAPRARPLSGCNLPRKGPLPHYLDLLLQLLGRW